MGGGNASVSPPGGAPPVGAGSYGPSMPLADDTRPSRVTDEPWLWAQPSTPVDRDPDLVGKWMVFVPTHLVDVEWRAVSEATRAGRLGIEAKVATAAPNPQARSDTERPIFIYTRDWRDRDDVERALIVLRHEVGVTAKAFYKRDIDTRAGRYGDGVSIYISPAGAAWFEDHHLRAAEPPPSRTAEPAAPVTAAVAIAPPAVVSSTPPKPASLDARMQHYWQQYLRRCAPVDPPMTLAEAVVAAFAQPDLLLEQGAVVRLYADLRDFQDDPHRPRWRRSADVGLAPDAVRRIVDALQGGAAEVFTEVFGDAYGFAADIGYVGSLEAWPEGSPEPT